LRACWASSTWRSIFVRQGIQLIFGAYPHSVEDPLGGGIEVFGLLLSRWRLLVTFVGLLTLVGVQALLHGTSLGLQLRAAVANRDLALSTGVNVDRLYAITFTGAGMLAGLAGFLLAPTTSIDPQLGITYLLPAFFVIVLAGFGSILGLVAGAAIIGGLQTMLSLFMSPTIAQILVLILAFFFIRLRSGQMTTVAI
jgi:branched-subunit amino acid ABC-type transport system permease component